MYDVRTWLISNDNTHIVQYLRTKGNENWPVNRT